MAEHRSTVAVGAIYFAAAMMIVVGVFDALQGLAAIIRKTVYVVAPDYLWKLDVTVWGWVHLLLGVLVALAGLALLGGALWARIVGIVLAALVAVTNFMWLPYYPVWAVVVIATSVVVIWALTMHGRDAVG